jgi:hypothetical protein
MTQADRVHSTPRSRTVLNGSAELTGMMMEIAALFCVLSLTTARDPEQSTSMDLVICNPKLMRLSTQTIVSLGCALKMAWVMV